MTNRANAVALRAGIAVLVCAMAAPAFATPLTGMGANLPIPSINPGEPPREPAVLTSVTGGFTGTWSSPALPDWIGTFSADGPIPSSNSNPAGITRYDFTTLPTGVLPDDTIFFFGDVDGGSTTTELFILNAFDATGALITTPWLDEPIGVSGVGSSGGTVFPTNMPGWEWDAGLGEYTIDGTTVSGNPSVAVWIESNTDIAFLTVNRPSNFANFGLSAPVPEPATLALVAMGAAAVLRRRSR